MATTTPNFGWSVPTSTDLVKDGATAIELLGDSIDASLVDLKGGTTGQVLSKASNTDMDFTWVTDAAGDITGVTAGTGISGGGTSGTVTVTNSMATAIDAKGDLIGGTGADTFSRLAVGANGTVLTADSAEATGLKWAASASASYTTLASGSVSSSALNITSISGSYKKLILILTNFTKGSAFDVNIQFNGVTSSNYSYITTGVQNNTVVNQRSSSTTALIVNTAGFKTSNNACLVMEMENYSNTVTTKNAKWSSWGVENSFSTLMNTMGTGTLNSTSAITSIQTDATFTSGDYILYGVN
jgi:hypothetical protein